MLSAKKINKKKLKLKCCGYFQEEINTLSHEHNTLLVALYHLRCFRPCFL
jgi:hypothetical protein